MIAYNEALLHVQKMFLEALALINQTIVRLLQAAVTKIDFLAKLDY